MALLGGAVRNADESVDAKRRFLCLSARLPAMPCRRGRRGCVAVRAVYSR